MSDYYDWDGKPMSFEEWVSYFKAHDARVVGRTHVGDVMVSTVWLGLDHSFGFGGPPLIFETMVFGGPLNGEQDRYSTAEQAREGHASMVARVEAAAERGLTTEEG